MNAWNTFVRAIQSFCSIARTSVTQSACTCSIPGDSYPAESKLYSKMSEPIQTDAPEIDPQLVEALGFSLLYTRNAGQNDDPALAEELSREAWQDSPEVRKGYRAQARFLIAELLDSAGCRLRSSDGKRLAQRLTWMQTIPPRQAYSADELR